VNVPATAKPRGARTREARVAGAPAVFGRAGLREARFAHNAAAAGVATGSFYTHFAGKEDAFKAVVAEMHEETLHPRLEVHHATDTQPAAPAGTGDAIARIEAAHRAYLLAYRRNARLMALLEQAALVDDDFRKLRVDRAQAMAQRNAKAIRRLQEQGLADPTLDPLSTAHALNAMVSRSANLVYVHGERIGFEKLLATLTRLWANALGLSDRSPTAGPGPDAPRPAR
jgi:AcrR family transcriptional regulator